MIGSNMDVVHCCPVFVGFGGPVGVQHVSMPCFIVIWYEKSYSSIQLCLYSNRDLEAIQFNSVPFASMHENKIPLQHAFFLGWCNLVVAIRLVLGNTGHVSWGHVPGPPPSWGEHACGRSCGERRQSAYWILGATKIQLGSFGVCGRW